MIMKNKDNDNNNEDPTDCITCLNKAQRSRAEDELRPRQRNPSQDSSQTAW